MKREHSRILREYPEFINKDVMYKLCHISKRTALFLLESGLVPCKNSGKKTRKYTIATADVVDYLIQREIEPERYLAPKGWYVGETKSSFSILPRGIRDKMYCYFENLMELYPDLLNINEVVEITGYGKSTVVRWCSSDKLYHFSKSGKFKIPKVSLLEFMMSIQFRRIRSKSSKHHEFIEDFSKYK